MTSTLCARRSDEQGGASLRGASGTSGIFVTGTDTELDVRPLLSQGPYEDGGRDRRRNDMPTSPDGLRLDGASAEVQR